MNEFLTLLKNFDVIGMFISPTKNSFLQFFRYIFVGGLATVVDWLVLFLLTDVVGIYYLLSAVVAFAAGLLANFLLSKLLVFQANKVAGTVFLEFFIYTIIGVIGLGLTELFLFCFTNLWHFHYMISKIIASAFVLLWNFFARKILLYK